MQKILVKDLPLEIQFELVKLLNSIDSIEDIESLREYTKEVIQRAIVLDMDLSSYKKRERGLVGIINNLERIIRNLISV